MRATTVATAICFSLAGLSFADGADAAMKRRTDIPAQSLAPALQTLVRERDIQLIYRAELIGDRRTGGASGEFTAVEALGRLLSGTGLTFQYLDEKTITIVPQAEATSGGELPLPRSDAGSVQRNETKSFWSRLRLAQGDMSLPSQRAEQSEGATSEAAGVEGAGQAAAKRPVQLDEVAVVGTRIKGVTPSSPVVTITHEEMQLSGHHTITDVIRALPQNFSGGQNPGVSVGATDGGPINQNVSGASSLNLRGLGPDATLTLLNGTRLPYDGFVQATDASVIPVAAIDRLEVLLDGASAIYGSDAVGGVADIHLKRDFQGAQISVRYGTTTDGGYEQNQYSAITGSTWSSGGFLIAGDLSRSTAVRVRQRDYLAHMPNQNDMIFPSSDQKGAVLNGHQQLGDATELTLTAFYTERDATRVDQPTVNTRSSLEMDSSIWGVAPAVRFQFQNDWSLRLHGVLGSNDGYNGRTNTSVATGGSTLLRDSRVNKVQAAGLESEGPLFAAPGGEARVSIGGGYRKNDYERLNLVAQLTEINAATRSRYGYAEINVPLVSEGQSVPFVTRLSLNGAVRYENYDTFGETTTPKIGVIWGITPALDFRASWGRSFKVPTLFQQFGASGITLESQTTFLGTPAGSTVILVYGGDPALRPERAEIVTAGFVLRPERLAGANIELSWFNIDYTDRVVLPFVPFAAALTNPAFSDYVVFNPTAAQQDAAFTEMGLPIGEFTGNYAGEPYNPANVFAIADYRNVNAASQRTSGIDASAAYVREALGGNLALNGNLSWISDSTYRLTSGSPTLPRAGIAYFPPKFRGRLGGSWSRNDLTISSYVSYLGGVRNTYIASNQNGDAMTTLDVVIDYRMAAGTLRGLGLNLSLTNAFDEKPPYLQPLQPVYPNFDTTNYSALGRTVSVTLTKQF